VPKGATYTGFGFGPDGYLTFNGANKFIGCAAAVPYSYQIYWLGDVSDVADPIGNNCVGPLYLYRTNVTLEGGEGGWV